MRVSYWLLPSEPAKSQLKSVINDLAARFAAPVFAPHVTLYSGVLTKGDRPNEALKSVSSRFAPIELQVSGVSFSQNFTQTLFIEFVVHDQLSRLADALKATAFESAEQELKPHLSLIYALLEDHTKQRLQAEIVAPAAIRFDSIAAMTSSEKTSSRSDVEQWDVSDGYGLTGNR